MVSLSNSSSTLLHSEGSRLANRDFIELVSSRGGADSGNRRVASDFSTLPSLKDCSDEDVADFSGESGAKRLATKVELLNEFSDADLTTFDSDNVLSWSRFVDGEFGSQGLAREANAAVLSSLTILLLYSAEIRRTKLEPEPEIGVEVTVGFKKVGAAMSDDPLVWTLATGASGFGAGGGAAGEDVSLALLRLNENRLTNCSELGLGDRTGGLLSLISGRK